MIPVDLQHLPELAAMLAAGILAGSINVMVGAGTLVSFPILLLLGLPPITATISNAIGIVPGSAAGVFVYRAELRTRARVVRVLLPASLAGGVAGAMLLLHLPAEVFSAVIPWLIAVGVVLVLLGPAIKSWVSRSHPAVDPTTTPPAFGSTAALIGSVVGAFGLGVYGGYFSAAQGMLLIALLGLTSAMTLQELNAIKNLTVGAVNLVAAAVFILVSPSLIAWQAVALIAIGSAVGGLVGGALAKRLPAPVLRVLVALVGVVTVVVMLLR